jgi:hypothetical protein
MGERSYLRKHMAVGIMSRANVHPGMTGDVAPWINTPLLTAVCGVCTFVYMYLSRSLPYVTEQCTLLLYLVYALMGTMKCESKIRSCFGLFVSCACRGLWCLFVSAWHSKKKDQLMLQTCWLHAIQPFETPINLLVEYLATLGSGAASTLGSGAGEKKTDRD